MAPEHLAADREPTRDEDAEPDVKDAAASEDEDASTEVRYQISSYGADYPVDGLVRRLQRGDIEVPRFQREFVCMKGCFTAGSSGFTASVRSSRI